MIRIGNVAALEYSLAVLVQEVHIELIGDIVLDICDSNIKTGWRFILVFSIIKYGVGLKLNNCLDND